MPDGDDNHSVAVEIEYDAPVSDAQSRPATAFEPFDVAVPCFCENGQLGVNAMTNVGGKRQPLSRGRAGERDLHDPDIAYYDIDVNNIANCNIKADR
jgi:hypothetical protein